MSFENFINSIFNSFLNVFNLIKNLFGPVVQNNFIKLIIYVILIFLFIDFLEEIFKLIKNIFAMKKQASKNKQNSNTDIE